MEDSLGKKTKIHLQTGASGSYSKGHTVTACGLDPMRVLPAQAECRVGGTVAPEMLWAVPSRARLLVSFESEVFSVGSRFGSCTLPQPQLVVLFWEL